MHKRMMATALLAMMLASPALAKTHRSVAACEARVAAAQQDWPVDPAPQPPDFSSVSLTAFGEADRAILVARYERLKASYNPHATRDYVIQTMQEHRCHGMHRYMDDPLPHTITISGTVYGDGTAVLEAR